MKNYRNNFQEIVVEVSGTEFIQFQSQFSKQAGGCTMGGPLSVTLSNKLEKDQVKPLKPKLFHRFVDHVISRRLYA